MSLRSSISTLRLGLLFSLALSLCACAETQFLAAKWKDYHGPSGSQGLFKIGNPYTVEGRTYRPQENYSLDETGIASWYGPGFHTRRTANGEVFNTNELTAAHRTLQLPALVRVTNLENGRSLVVRVNDRGPFSRGRIIDVSKKAADLLGFRGRGTARVRVQVLAEESRQMAEAAKRGQDTRGMEVALNNAPPMIPPTSVSGMDQGASRTEGGFAQNGVGASPAPMGMQMASYAPVPVESEVLSAPAPSSHTVYTPSGVQGHTGSSGEFYPDPVVAQFPVTPTAIYVQAGSFSHPENAARVADTLHGLGSVRVRAISIAGSTYYRVQVGPLQDVATADVLLSQVTNRGYPDSRITVDSHAPEQIPKENL